MLGKTSRVSHLTPTAGPDFERQIAENDAIAIKFSETEEGRAKLLETASGTRALLYNTPIGRELLKDRKWRLGHLYNFRHIKTGQPCNLDWEQDYMEEMYDSIWGGKQPTLRNIWLKSRQVFITTTCCALMIDYCIFSDLALCGISNYSNDDVELTIKEKLHFCVENSPFLQIMKVETYSTGLFFPRSGGKITVAQTGVGRTIGFTLITEFAKTAQQDPAKAEEVVRGLFAAGDYSPIIIESSSRGPGGEFFRIVERARKNKISKLRLDRKAFIFHFIGWTQKTFNRLDVCSYDTTEFDSYFEKIEEETGKTVDQQQRNWFASTLYHEFSGDRIRMAQEHAGIYDEAFQSNTDAFIINKQIRQVSESGRILPIAYDPTNPVFVSWDFGWNDHTAFMVWQPGDGGFVNILHAVKKSQTPLENFFADLNGMNYPIMMHFLPEDAFKDNAHVNQKLVPGATTIASFFRRADKRNIKRVPAVTYKRAGFETSMQFCRMVRINDKCTELIEDLLAVRRQYIKVAETFVDKLHPHNPPNHLYDCFETTARVTLDMPNYTTGRRLPESFEDDTEFADDDCGIIEA